MAATQLETSMPNRLDPQPLNRFRNYGTLLAADMANMKKIRHNSRKRPKRNLAMAAAPAAMPVNPNSAATIAIIKKITAQRNIVSPP
jgi:hypothetical protein